MKWLKLVLLFMACLLILVTSKDLLLNPTPFLDEGYYLGATHAVLRGDFFMRGYAFDKPFLLAFWPLPGILLMGENPIGFRLVSLLLYLSSFILLVTLLESLARSFFRNYFLGLGLFLLPLMQRHGISNFCEPYMIFSVLLMVRALVKETEGEQHGFFAGFFTKYSMVLWCPMIAMSWFIQKPFSLKEFGNRLFSFFKKGRYWLLAGLFFSLANANKFGSLTWFSIIHAEATPDKTLWLQLSTWSNIFWRTFEHPLFSGLALLLFITGLLLAVQKRDRKNLLLFWIPCALHFFLITFSGARFYDRYLVIWLPVFIICLSLAFQEIERRWKPARWGTFALALTTAAFGSTLPKLNLGGPPELGRKIQVTQAEVDRPAVFLFDQFGWETSAFYDKTVRTGCTLKDCVAEAGNGGLRLHQYALVSDDQRHPQLFRAPLSDHPTPSEISVPFSIKSLPEKTITQVRLNRDFDVVEADWLPGEAAQAADFPGWKKLFDGQRLHVKAVSKRIYPFRGTNTIFEITGALGINEVKDWGNRFNQPRYVLVMEVESVRVDSKDLTDLVMPLCFGGYTLRLGALPVEYHDNLQLSEPRPEGNHLRVKVSHSWL